MAASGVVLHGEEDGIPARQPPAARRHGVEKVPCSLGDTLPHEDRPGLAATLEATDKLLEDG